MHRQTWFTMILAALLVGCASAPAPVPTGTAWIGRPAAELLAALGPPTSEYEDGLGGTVLVYDRSSTEIELDRMGADGMRGLPFRNEPTPSVRQHTSVRRFYVSPEGLVYKIE